MLASLICCSVAESPAMYLVLNNHCCFEVNDDSAPDSCKSQYLFKLLENVASGGQQRFQRLRQVLPAPIGLILLCFLPTHLGSFCGWGQGGYETARGQRSRERRGAKEGRQA